MLWYTEFHVLENFSHGIQNKLTHIHTHSRAPSSRNAIKFTFISPLRCSFVQLSAYLLIHKFPAADLYYCRCCYCCHCCRCRCAATTLTMIVIVCVGAAAAASATFSKWHFKWANKIHFELFQPIFSQPQSLSLFLSTRIADCRLRIVDLSSFTW